MTDVKTGGTVAICLRDAIKVIAAMTKVKKLVGEKMAISLQDGTSGKKYLRIVKGGTSTISNIRHEDFRPPAS